MREGEKGLVVCVHMYCIYCTTVIGFIIVLADNIISRSTMAR